MEKNSKAAINKDEYEIKYNELAKKYEELKINIEEKEKEKKLFNQKIKYENIKEFIGRLEKYNSLITEFDEEIWNGTFKEVSVKNNKLMVFEFKDRSEIYDRVK